MATTSKVGISPLRSVTRIAAMVRTSPVSIPSNPTTERMLKMAIASSIRPEPSAPRLRLSTTTSAKFNPAKATAPSRFTLPPRARLPTSDEDRTSVAVSVVLPWSCI